MQVTKPILLKHIDLTTASKIIQRAVNYAITTQVSGKNTNGHYRVITSFSISSLIEKIEEHIKRMRENHVDTNKKLIKTLTKINTKLKEDIQ